MNLVAPLLLVVFGVVFWGSPAQGVVQFRVIRQWKYLNYTWPSYESYRKAAADNLYIPTNVVTAGVAYHNDWLYLTMPRMREGVPASLGRIPASSGGSASPLVSPYPSWEFNRLDDCDALQNVQNVEVDLKDRMWIIDGGHTETLSSSPHRNCLPKLLIYDVKNNLTLTKYEFPESVAHKNDSFLYDLVVDSDFAYITDNSRVDPGIIVFSLAQRHAWKIRHETMRANVSAQHFQVHEVTISTPINVAGIALGPKVIPNQGSFEINEDREVFYCPLSSRNLYSISTLVLQNETNANNGLDYSGPVKNVGVKASQTDGMIMTNRGILYYGLLANNSIAKWDLRTPFESGQKIVSKDVNYIQWTNSFTIDLQGNVIVLTNTLQEFIYKELNVSRHNFWLLSAHTGAKSYLYGESLYDYHEEGKPTGDSVSTVVTGMPSPPTSHQGHSNPSNKTELMQATSAPDDGNRQLLNLSLIILLCTFWFANMDF